ncbi:cation diffusion facilitator family transporter [Algivirga pacifica]|uniref:Cation diffusion facilitator family transporter n=1 Tax=Algivirga pacifica TaxID=1162670 RepID=A0ABP9DGE6_9BACT
MGHNHNHTHDNFGKAFAIGIGLNTVYITLEAFYGFATNSSALLADAGHNTSDVFGLVLAWAAIWIAKKKPSGKYTYGLRKTTILVSLLNSLLIILASGFILWDAIEKIQNPIAVPSSTIMIVASIGLFINAGTALMFMKGQHDLNIKGAFLHMAADAGVTLAVLIGGLVMKYTDAFWVDPCLSFLIVGVILYGTWGLLVDSVKLVIDAVPKNIDVNEVEDYLKTIEDVEDVHDLHVWALSTTETALTAHLVIPKGYEDQLLYDVRDKLHQTFNITHTTLQVEKEWGNNKYCSCFH